MFFWFSLGCQNYLSYCSKNENKWSFFLGLLILFLANVLPTEINQSTTESLKKGFIWVFQGFSWVWVGTNWVSTRISLGNLWAWKIKKNHRKWYGNSMIFTCFLYHELCPRATSHDWCRKEIDLIKITWTSADVSGILVFIITYIDFPLSSSKNSLWGVAALDFWSSWTGRFQKKKQATRNDQFLFTLHSFFLKLT